LDELKRDHQVQQASLKQDVAVASLALERVCIGGEFLALLGKLLSTPLMSRGPDQISMINIYVDCDC
jgi:hypothetical protein